MNLDSGSGAAIAANAKSQGVKVIDYDRLTLDTDANDYYVSFDNEKVGELQGQGLVDCVGDKQGAEIAVLNGSPTDNNATLFKNGYDSVIDKKFDSGDWTKIDDQSVPDWDNQKALTIFEQMLQANNNKVDGVLAANDGLGNAAISALKQRKLPQVPVTGQDATLEGIQNIVNGDQCMTVYKAIKNEADAAADACDRAREGRGADARPRLRSTTDRTRSRRSCSSRCAVTKDNIKDYLGEVDFPTKEDICAGKVAAKCEELGHLGRLRAPGRSRAPRGVRLSERKRRECSERHAGAGAARGHQALRRGRGPARSRLPRQSRRGHGARRRQRGRQVHADQVRGRHPQHRRR